jgi:6-pyruvoyltetrahydropterin/6-carboxytetrahydropterin synthase
MYELTVEREFCAAHAITIAGEREAVHGHNWRVRVVVAGPALDADGLLCDFHDVERRLDEVLAPFRNQDLNRTAPFDRLNPTAEHVARHLAAQLTERLAPCLPAGTAVASVSVTEAPGCSATFRIPTP